jgi:lipoate-protein ligase B
MALPVESAVTGPERRTETPVLEASWLGVVEYQSAWSLQQRLWTERLEGARVDSLVLLEHPPTYTLGRRAAESDVVYRDDELAARGISVFKIDRGGRATYHGPGQLVGYPIIALGERYDVLTYLRRLEEALIKTARDLGVEAHRDPRHTGVWVGQDKIGAIGVKITRGITMHGFAFNLTTDLAMFEGIVPCGIADRGVTSVEALTQTRHSVRGVASLAARHLATLFGRTLAWVEAPAARDGALGAAAGSR